MVEFNLVKCRQNALDVIAYPSMQALGSFIAGGTAMYWLQRFTSKLPELNFILEDTSYAFNVCKETFRVPISYGNLTNHVDVKHTFQEIRNEYVSKQKFDEMEKSLNEKAQQLEEMEKSLNETTLGLQQCHLSSSALENNNDKLQDDVNKANQLYSRLQKNMQDWQDLGKNAGVIVHSGDVLAADDASSHFTLWMIQANQWLSENIKNQIEIGDLRNRTNELTRNILKINENFYQRSLECEKINGDNKELKIQVSTLDREVKKLKEELKTKQTPPPAFIPMPTPPLPNSKADNKQTTEKVKKAWYQFWPFY